jgi:hypothetical protein
MYFSSQCEQEIFISFHNKQNVSSIAINRLSYRRQLLKAVPIVKAPLQVLSDALWFNVHKSLLHELYDVRKRWMKRWLHHFEDIWRLGEQAPPAQPPANFEVISFSLGFAINRRAFRANHSDLLE